jgi:glycerate 2-kinase
VSASADGPRAAQRPPEPQQALIVIANSEALAGSGMASLRGLTLRVAAAGLDACDVAKAAAAAVELTANGVSFAGREYQLAPAARMFLVGAGKATLAIAAALERVLGDRLDRGAVVVRDGEDTIALERVEVLVADHPLPSDRSVVGARRVLEIAAAAQEGDLVIGSFTGGSSALVSLPPDGVSAAEKRRLHELLLGSGAPITAVNAVRKQVSAIKGGRLAARIAPATLVNLTVSDVAGDVLDVLTDPTVEDSTTAEDAIAVLRARGLWDDVPPSVRRHLRTAGAAPVRLEREPQTVLLVTGASVCEAMLDEARAAGVEAHLVSTELEGEATEVGRALAEIGANPPVAAPCVLVGCGGESTVAVGDGAAFGEGGPNQEAALALALALPPGAAVAACLLDTDGSDGGTPIAGAVVDGDTVRRAAAAGIDLAAAVAGHRSAEAIAALGDQVITGPTQTNVNDLFVLTIGAVVAGLSA